VNDQSDPEPQPLLAEPPATDLLARAADAVARGRYEEAKVAAALAEARAREARDQVLALQALVVLGDAERRLGRLDSARHTLDPAVAALRRLLGDDHPAARDGLLASAALAVAGGRPADALALLEWTSGPVDDLGRFVEALVTKSDAETALGRQTAAEATIALAQAVAHADAGPRAARAAAGALTRGARYLRGRGARAEAEQALGRARALLTNLSATHPDLADVLGELGSLTADRGDPLNASIHWLGAATIADLAGDVSRAESLRRRAAAGAPPSPPTAPLPGPSTPRPVPSRPAPARPPPVPEPKSERRVRSSPPKLGPPPRAVPAGLGVSVIGRLYLSAAIPLVVAGAAFYHGAAVAAPNDALMSYVIGAGALVLAALVALLAWSNARLAAHIFRLGRVVPATVTRLVVVTRGPHKRLVHFNVYVTFQGGSATFRRFGREVRGSVDLLVLDRWALLHLPGFAGLAKVHRPSVGRG
jgi:tetratricopeptide (TPR) repeat protein